MKSKKRDVRLGRPVLPPLKLPPMQRRSVGSDGEASVPLSACRRPFARPLLIVRSVFSPVDVTALSSCSTSSSTVLAKQATRVTAHSSRFRFLAGSLRSEDGLASPSE